jgi:hypothetical protein
MASMTSSDVGRVVREALEAYRPPLTAGATVGAPWSLDRIEDELCLLREALVLPSLRTLHVHQQADEHVWLVAVEKTNAVYYDESREEFGLGGLKDDGSIADWGLYGDLPGTFMAR